MQESKLARISRTGKEKLNSHGLADRVRLQEAPARWLGELKVLENPARLHEARARWLGELAVQECKLEGVRRPHKVARDRARLQEALARWLGELKVQESSIAQVSMPGKVARGTSEVALRTCDA
ncbi:hypothetical protein CDL15_Pgr002280 [Punica granatum]|uniref:Uncharacterized protein n=1 Tax=Punica granatum TaxID=22663 RepID=A0A218XGQ8_PUNGR|nr:hypothetical protein CDL15_Pgr002280 [Punica granatum]